MISGRNRISKIGDKLNMREVVLGIFPSIKGCDVMGMIVTRIGKRGKEKSRKEKRSSYSQTAILLHERQTLPNTECLEETVVMVTRERFSEEVGSIISGRDLFQGDRA